MSERYIPAPILSLMDEDLMHPFVFVEAEFPAPVNLKRVWSGDGEYTDENMNVWEGRGDILGMGMFKESVDSAAQGLAVRFKGIDPDTVKDMIGGDYQYGEISVYLGLCDMVTKTIYVDWENPTWRGSLDSDEEERDPDLGSNLTISCEHEMIDQLRKREFRYTHQDQMFLYPGSGDTGLIHMEKIQKLIVPWGKTQK